MTGIVVHLLFILAGFLVFSCICLFCLRVLLFCRQVFYCVGYKRAKRQKGKKAKRRKGEKEKRRKGEKEKRRKGERRKGEKEKGEKEEKRRKGEKEKSRKGEKGGSTGVSTGV